ncbi:Lcl C-terminal domain-containing protein [Sideroxydans lithotrophicus]|uniref:Lcl C-terminal domain-containing protein n=1 Tax=Sideroxydans lithotrophicus (strain ES-1) TaxID=580332 RepID=D5CR58_SIDLE|nr:DUF1566 domain-containing protein [Sideroxydans lithotrophicus]ADE11444.1 protein of unknown function DUF1566 [Sideroxydans lithotrophicus ES-1]
MKIHLSVLLVLGVAFSNVGYCGNLQSVQSDERWEFDGDLLYDNAFDLTWQRCAIGQKFFGKSCVGGAMPMTLPQAKEKEKDGWRLPTHSELLTLIKYDVKPYIDDKAFPGFACCYYWTGEYNSDREGYYYVLFDRGDSTYRDERSNHLVRFVRSGRLQKK